MNIIKKINLNDIYAGIKYITALIIGKIFKPLFSLDIWLISERGDEARDNGYHLYKYIREKHPEIHCYYLIKKESADYQKISKYLTIIEYGSLKHFIYYIISKVYKYTCISLYSRFSCYPKLDKLFGINKIRVFLQHGIIKDYHPYLAAEYNKLDLFCCGAKKESEYIKRVLGYDLKNVAICTGLARYDGLYEFNIKKQILLMPT